MTVPEVGGADGDIPVRVDVCLLGAVEMRVDDRAVPLPDPARDLLAVLALRAGEPLSPGLVSAALWAVPAQRGVNGGRLDNAVAALDAALRDSGLRDVLGRDPAGLVLRLPGRQIDAPRFARDLVRAREAMAADQLDVAAERFEAALARWRVGLDGTPLAGCALNADGWAAAEQTRLVLMRAGAVEDRWECRLRLAARALTTAGGPTADAAAIAAGADAPRVAGEAAADLERALTRHPLRERLWELLLTATAFANGRRVAAAVFDRATATFADNVGVEPTERLAHVAALAKGGGLAEWFGGGATLPPTSPAPALSPGVTRAPLPVPMTPLIGRDQLLGRIAGRLAAYRVVTLTGPGGAGKTRLAIATAARVGAAFPMAGSGTPLAGRPTWFVDLSAVDTPMRVPAAVADALGVRDEPGRDIVETLADDIGPAPALLVLDNCEQLVPGCAELAARLLERCPELRILATSRIALRVEGEVTVPVPSLPGPRPGTGHTVAALSAIPASRLFLDRARARSGRPIPDAEADAVARLCAELDGLPLAIELAAARTPLLSVQEIVERLRSDLTLLRSPDPTAPARHRTVVAAVESSVEQLGPDAAALFDRLAVFAGGFDAEAVRSVADGEPADLVAALVDASLVETVPEDGTTARFRMLVPIRRHALARLRAADGEDAARRAHARHYLDLAERADAELRGAAQERWLGRLRADFANLRAAMGWLGEAGAAAEPYGDLRLAAAVATYCRLEGHYRDGRAWLAAALARHTDAPAPLRARAGAGAAMFAMLLCDYPAAADYAAAARTACRVAGDRLGEARVELTLGSVARERADYRASAIHLDAAAELFAGYGDEWGEAQAALLRGFTAWLAGDLDRAEPRLRASLRRYEELGDPEAAATALMNLGAVAFYRGDPDRAASLLDTALARFAVLGFPEGVGWAHNLRGLVDLRAGRADLAATHLTLSLAVHRHVGDRWRTASVLEALAEVARLDGQPVRGAALLGAAAQIRTEIGSPVPPCERRDLAASAAALRTTLGDERYERAYRRGSAATLDTVLAERDPDPTPAPIA